MILRSSGGALGITSLSLVCYTLYFINSIRMMTTASHDRDCSPTGLKLGVLYLLTLLVHALPLLSSKFFFCLPFRSNFVD